MNDALSSRKPLKRKTGHDLLRIELLDQIITQQLKPGDVLLSVQKLSSMYGIPMRAVQEALRDLIAEGWLYSKHRVGVFVADRGERPTIEFSNVSSALKKVVLLRSGGPSDDVGSTFFLEITRPLEQYLLDHGQEMTFAPIDSGKTIELFEREADNIGVVIVPVTPSLCSIPKHYSLPCVSLCELPEEDMGRRFDAVVTQNELGAYQAVTHLIQYGHRKIGHLAGSPVTSGEERLRGYTRAMEEAGLEVAPGFVVRTRWEVQEGYQGMLQILARRPDVTAVFAATDRLLIGALRALHECGREAPRDISVVGFDDLDLAGHVQPPLTTIHWDRSHMGQIAGQLAIRRLMEPDREGSVIRLGTKLVLRDSTARIEPNGTDVEIAVPEMDLVP